MKRVCTSAFVILLSGVLCAGIRENAENAILNEFGHSSKLSFKKYELSDSIKDSIEMKVKQRFYSDFVYTWVISFKDSIIGYALLDNVKGKTMPITFLTMFDTGEKLVNASILKYREPIGGEVGRKFWLNQFLGKTSESEFDDIDGISGATISVISVTRGIQKLTLLLNLIKNDLMIDE